MQVVTRTLGEICAEAGGFIRTGPFGSQLHERDYQTDGLPVIMPKDILDGTVSLATIARVGDDVVRRLQHHRLRKGDIVYGRRGDIGRHALITEREDGWLCGTGCIRISPGATIVDPVFLHYYLTVPQVIAWVLNQAIGATLPNLNAGIVRSIAITYPILPIQRRIASILSAYDDLIENNLRRIKILEEMTQAIYHEWFVHFRFPGHEQVKRVDSAMGKIPEGWDVKPIGQAIETVGGSTPSTSVAEYWEDGTIDWYTPTDLTKNGHMVTISPKQKITALGLSKSSARLFPGYSVMMTSRATIGVVAINTRPACTNQGFITCIPNQTVSAYLMYHWIRENREQIMNIASGATCKEISRTEFRQMLILVPDPSINDRFAAILEPMVRNLAVLSTKNIALRRTRDLLLPKLVSGEIDLWELHHES